ncbi:unnamed protein product [Fraxinus pennsylvanica]|uniref:MPN domain-containing protein n=1 Tax=Fraxinus pennsylvanica TaxID=56036 RepID=A0AAD1ZAU4_9LAMI|nr:unnamed protein product [Fraxinus pennsylvanica]
MPESGTGVSVEAVDHVFQTNMLDILKQTGRPKMVVGWYHSHPGFGCWHSGVDIHTQQSFEALNKRAVAVVVDSIQCVVVIDAFRLINPQTMMLGQEPRRTTANLGYLLLMWEVELPPEKIAIANVGRRETQRSISRSMSQT